MKVLFKDLKEYDDLNGNGQYDNEDAIISMYSLEQATFSPITYDNTTSTDGEKISVISMNTTDNMFTVRFYATERYAYISNSLCSPSEIKMDFIIDKYPFQGNDTCLALSLELQTMYETDVDQNSFDEMKGYAFNESQFSISSDNKTGFFSWTDYVDADNKTRSINSSITSEKKQLIQGDTLEVFTTNTISFSYPHAQSILHDPKIGVVSISSESYELSELLENAAMTTIMGLFSYIIVCILTAILFIGAIYFRKKV